MKKCYMITLNSAREPVLEFLNAQPDLNWRASCGAIFIASDYPLNYLNQLVHNKFPTIHFTIHQIEGLQVYGWADPATWDFINRPRAIGEP